MNADLSLYINQWFNGVLIRMQFCIQVLIYSKKKYTSTSYKPIASRRIVFGCLILFPKRRGTFARMKTRSDARGSLIPCCSLQTPVFGNSHTEGKALKVSSNVDIEVHKR